MKIGKLENKKKTQIELGAAVFETQVFPGYLLLRLRTIDPPGLKDELTIIKGNISYR